jgi:hypothetical protein
LREAAAADKVDANAIAFRVKREFAAKKKAMKVGKPTYSPR